MPNSWGEKYSLPQTVESGTNIWSFQYSQYRALNYILYTNAFNDKCTFPDSSKKELCHVFFECSHPQILKKKTFSWWFKLVKKNITRTMKDIILGLLNRTDIINYLIILGEFGNESHWAKWVTFGQMGQTWEEESHFINMGHTYQNCRTWK